MAEKKEEESKIPLFTVIKNGAILKNIFLINNPPPPPSISITSVENEETPDQENQEILIIGRHPDCHIMLTHPSISRFHLQIQSNPSTQKLSVIDLSSVHGTWVSEKKIEPGVPVEMNEGDVLKIGGSTRVYRLHWVPMGQAYDMNNSFVSQMDLKEVENQGVEERKDVAQQDEDSLSTETKQIEGEDCLVLERTEGTFQDEISASVHGISIQSLDLDLDGIVSLSSDENLELMLENEIPSSGIESEDLSLPVGFNTSVCEEQQLGKENQIPRLESVTDVSGRENLESSLIRSEKKSNAMVSLFASSSDAKGKEILGETKNQSPLQKDNERNDDSEVWSKSLVKEFMNTSPGLEVQSEIKMEKLYKENQKLQPLNAIQPLSEIGNKENSSVNQDLSSLVNQNSTCFDEENCCLAAEVYEEAENRSSSGKGPIPKGIPSFDSGLFEAESVNSSLPFGEITENKKCQTPQSLFASGGGSSLENSESFPLSSDKWATSNSIWSRRGKPASVLQIQTSRSRRWTKGDCNNADVEFQEQEDMENRLISKILFSDLEEMEEETFTPEKENITPNSLVLKSLQRKGMLEENKQSRSCIKSSSKVIFSPNIQPEEAWTLASDKENQTPKLLRVQEQEDMENRLISKILFSDLEEMEEETFTPEKENITPNSLVLKSLQRKGMLEENKQCRSCIKSSSKVIFSPNIQPEEAWTLASDKENQTPKLLRVQKIKKGTNRSQVKLEREGGMLMRARPAERVPFQPLLENFPGEKGNRRSVALLSNATTRSSNSVKFTPTTEVTDASPVGEGRRSWTMVVDISTLLDKESRKSIQLLQGLKGTQLIIPRMVIRELDCLKRRGSLFRRTSEVSSLLEWIEECMVKINWWIHIQSTVEEGRPVAPTPPASPQSQFTEGSGGFPCGTTSWGPFSSSCTRLSEIVSPTSEDHVLDYAILFRKMKNVRHLVLLSNDVTMKVKAMAEGLICETAQEFRESLVNPFSKRFLWADSSPRGRTWSYLDDVVLREKYSRGPLKPPSKEGDGAKGLKLILLHNSHYAQIRSVR